MKNRGEKRKKCDWEETIAWGKREAWLAPGLLDTSFPPTPWAARTSSREQTVKRQENSRSCCCAFHSIWGGGLRNVRGRQGQQEYLPIEQNSTLDLKSHGYEGLDFYQYFHFCLFWTFAFLATDIRSLSLSTVCSTTPLCCAKHGLVHFLRAQINSVSLAPLKMLCWKKKNYTL